MSPQFFDIGMNATDTQFQGVYRSKRKHDSDFTLMHQRSIDAGCTHWLITGGELQDAREALELAKTNINWFSTAGVHPTRSNVMVSHSGGLYAYLAELKELIRSGKAAGKIKALGEFGLDYDRLDWSSKEDQLPVFTAQLDIALEADLPLFLHSRACEEDFLRLLLPLSVKLPRRGVIHSFTGSLHEMQQLTEHGWSIGINGCSLKTAENLEVVREVPLELLMLETDAPWCDIRPSHAGHKFLQMDGAPKGPENKKIEKFEMGKMVRSRNEPCSIQQVAWIVAQVKGVTYDSVAKQVFENTIKMFA